VTSVMSAQKEMSFILEDYDKTVPKVS
jgi:hypothetical protein